MMASDRDLTDDTWGEPNDRGITSTSTLALDELTITGLWNVAKRVTPEVAEQSWLVAYCVKAGKDGDWLEAKAGERLFLKPAPLGMFPDGETDGDDGY